MIDAIATQTNVKTTARKTSANFNLKFMPVPVVSSEKFTINCVDQVEIYRFLNITFRYHLIYILELNETSVLDSPTM